MSHRSSQPLHMGTDPAITACPSGFLHRTCSCGEHTAAGGECEECKKKQGSLQRHSTHEYGPAIAPAIVHDVLASPGQSLSDDVRTTMGLRFGHDFSRVQVHTDSRAAESARSVNALAYTVGDHIAFQAGQYNPSSGSGQRLLAHELTHVVQNSKNGNPAQGSALSISRPTDASEHEADAAGRLVASGAKTEVCHAPSATMQRDWTDIAKGAGIAGGIIGGAALLGWGISKLFGGGKSDQDPACAKSLAIPDDVHKAVGKAWGESGHGGDVVAEHGGRIVTDKSGKRTIRTGAGGSGSISLPGEEAGDVTTGTFHTHPYSKSEGSTLGVAFSGGDISNFIAGGQGSVKYVGAGSCNFVLNTIDQTKRDACKTKDIEKLWNDAFGKASGSFQDKVATAVKASTAGCGICFYRACRPNDKSDIPQTASLA
jgi:hypothetical protein